MADENPYMPLVEKDAEQGVRASMLTAVEKQPDTEAKLQDLARRYNMPVEAVRLNQPEVQRRAAFEAVDYETLAREMPSTAAWLSSPENAAIAHDNVDSMGAIERKLRQFVGGAVESVGMSAAGVGQLGDIGQRMLANDFAAIFLPEPQRGPMGLEPQRPTIESLAGPLIGEGWRQSGGAVKDYGRFDISGVGEKTFADQVFGGIGQVAGQALLLPVLRGGGLYAQGAESMAEKVAGDKADQRTKDLAVLGGAAVTGATEAWALDKLLGPLAVPVKNQIGAALARIGIGAAAEGGQEFSENLLQDIIRKALTNNDAEIDVGQSVEEGGVGAAVGGVVRTVIESALHIKARGDSRAKQAEQGAQAIAELSDLAKTDKLLQRNPQAFEQFVKQAAENGPVTTVYIDAQTLMQSGVVRELADVSPSVAEQIETAVATGGQVAIPVEEFAARIAPTDFAQSLIDHIRTDPDGFTRAEAQEYMQSQADNLQQEVERTLTEKQGDATFQQSQEAVKTRIREELDALGRFTTEKNEADATLFASYYATRAAQLGVTPEALYDQRRVRFAAEDVAGQQFQQTGTVEGMPDNQAPGPQGEAQQGANKGNAVSKHSPEQLAKWAAEKRARESRQAAQAEADRQLERRLSQNSIERMRKSPMWGAFTQEERSEIEGYSNSRDRAEEGRMATVSAIGRALSDAGLTIEKVSESNDGKSKSIYVRAGDQVVRISDHELPMTAKRQNDRERGLSGRWDREVIVFDWTDSTMADYMVEVLGVAEAGRLGYEIGSRQQGENTSDGDGRSVSQTDQSAPDTDGAMMGIDQTETPEFKRLSALLGPSGVTRLMQSLGNKAIVDGLKRNAKALSDLLESHPGFSEQGRLIDIPPSVVGHVVKVVDDEQIRRAVVIALPVDVVNLLSGKQLSADQVLSDKAMLKNVLSVDGASDVSLAIDKSSAKALLRSVANQATELASLADRSLKSGPARLTNAGDSVFRTHTGSVTETEAFSKWFGDSKVVDSAGKPLVVYHGTRGEFTVFDYSRIGQQGRAEGAGFYFTNSKDVASGYGAPMEVFLSIKKPLAYDAKPFSRPVVEKIVRRVAELEAQAEGGDIADGFLANFGDVRSEGLASVVRQAGGMIAADETALDQLSGIVGSGVNPEFVNRATRDVTGFDGVVAKGFSNAGDASNSIYVAFFPEQIKSATGNRGTFDPNDPNILNQSAFHGTPHRGITKFSTDKIGTGEGAQAYGWGLYFASKREIAEYYREALAPGDTAYSVDGEVAFSGAPNQADPREVAVYAIANGADPATLADKYEDQGVSEDFVTGVRAAVAALDGKKVERVESKEGQLYEVDIPEDSEMLLWDKPLSEQPEAVRKVLEKLRADGWRFSDSLRGDAFYQYVARTAYPVKGDKAASESLAALGIKGIKYLDGTSRADGDGSYNYVVFSGDDVTIKNQFYQQARGAFSPESFTITLLNGADLSTALHEGAHFFFENDIDLAADLVRENGAFGADTQTEGERQIIADVSKLLKWHGISGTIEEQLATWYGMDFESRRVAHERTAESFEKYLFEGRAPSLDLAQYFQKFRAWMLSVYKSLKQFLTQNPEAGKLDDTVRQVFDRMLATSEQIKLAEKGRSMFPLFSTAEEAGMSVEEFAAYQAQAVQPTADAIQDLQARGLRDLQWLRNATGKELKRLQKQAAVLRAEARIDARREVMSQPVYRAWQFLTGRMSKDDKAALKQEQVKATTGLNVERDSLFVAIAKLGGLDRDAVQKAWGWDPAERTPQPAFGRPLLRREGGLSIDAMAQLLAENGYLGEVDGTADYLSEFEAKFDAEYRGDAQYSFSHDYARSMERRAGDGVDLDSLNAGRLDAWSLDDMGLPPTIPEFLKGLGMTAKDGLHPDIVADRFGFPSGDEMVRTLAAAQTPKEAIEALTDRLMMERHGELSTPEAIAQAADAAVHNAARARMLATEANALAQASGSRKVLVDAAREFARNVVARVKVGELRPSQYTNAAARAGKLSDQASKSGDVATAAAEKRNQLVQTLAAREAFDAREEVAGLRRAWSSLANRSDEKLKKSYDMDIVNAVRAILANVGVAEGKGKKAAEYLESLQQYDPAMHAVISQSVTAAEAIGKPLNGMTIEEVRGLADEIEALLHLARRSRQMEVDGKLLDREEIEDALQARMAEIGIPDELPGKTSAITPGEQRLAKFRTLIAAGRRVESWVNSMDSQDMGPFRRFIFGPVKDAADSYRADKAKYLKQFRDLFDTIAPTLKPQLIAAPELGYTFGKDSGGSAINEIVHAILHTGNESNKRKLLVGRGWAQVLDSGDLDTSRWDAFINRMAAEGKLKKEHFDFAQGVWDLLEQTKPLAQKTHRDVFGKYFDEITAEPVQTPFGVYAGGYVPAMADSRIVTDAKLRKLREDENAGMSYAFPTTPTGFTKARVEYNRPLMLDLRTLAQHIDKVLLFSHMTGPVRDVQKILTDVGTTLDKVSPGSLDGMLTPWLNRSASQQVTSPISADGGTMRFFATMRSRAGMAAMFGNVVNTAQQITGFSIASVKVKPRLLLSAAVDLAKGPKSFVRAVTEASPYMAGRLDNEVAAMNDQINEILLNPSMLEKGEAWTKKHAYFLQSAMDSWMSPIVWKGAYDQALERGLSHEDAVKLGDSAVRETQGSSLPEDVSRFETGNAFIRLFTQFAGYFNMQANLLGTEFVKVARDMGLRSGAARGLYVFLLGFAAPAIVSELIVQLSRGGPPDEDDDGYLDDWLSALFVWAPMRNATAMVPGVGQGVNAVVNATNGKPYDDRLATSPAISMLETAARAPYSAYRAVVEGGSAQKAVRDVATLISMTVGLPANLAARPVGYLAGVDEGRIEPDGPGDFARGLVTGTDSRP